MSSALSLHAVAKRFGRVEALAGVDLEARRGEVHAVLGENGAGKSTLMKIIYGLVAPDAGTIELDGHAARFAGPVDARRAGIGMVHQEFALVDALSVAENLAVALSPPGEWRWRRDRVAAAAARLADSVGLHLGDLDAPVGALPVGLRQRIEIVKALAGETRILILDEPTAVLTPGEVESLFEVLARLRAAGTAILFITHKLAEVMAIADRITVMRHGRVVGCVTGGEVDAAALARLMVGTLERADDGVPPMRRDAAVQLRIDGVCTDGAEGRLRLRDITLDVHAGEIIGIAGVDGNGQEELFEVLTGMRAVASGTIAVGGAHLRNADPAAAIAAGIGSIPPDRLRQGAIAEMSITDNASLNVRLLRTGGSVLRPRVLRERARAMVERYAIKAGDLDAPARSLSGGNMQKLVIARALATAPRVIVAANPTRGLDIAAAEAVYAALLETVARGTAVVLISTDLDEIVARAHRVAVLCRGGLSAPLERPFTVDRLGPMMAGSAAA